MGIDRRIVDDQLYVRFVTFSVFATCDPMGRMTATVRGYANAVAPKRATGATQRFQQLKGLFHGNYSFAIQWESRSATEDIEITEEKMCDSCF